MPLRGAKIWLFHLKV